MKLLFVYLLYGGYSLAAIFTENKLNYQIDVEEWLNDIDKNLSEFNYISAYLTWTMATNPSDSVTERAKKVALVHNHWTNMACESQLRPEFLTPSQERKMFLLCRGAKFTNDKIIPFLNVAAELAAEYNRPLCISEKFRNLPLQAGDCVFGEPDLERLMRNSSFSVDELEWLWLEWHDSVGPRVKRPFAAMVEYQNEAARNYGYDDFGQVWREELEIPDLETVVEDLFEEIRPLYEMLHAVIRHKLYEKFGPEGIDLRGPIPVHLLGNMWGQDWSTLINLFPFSERIDLNERLLRKHPSVKDLVLEAEDYYTSLSLPKMTDKFWRYSIFEKDSNATVCHGSAANLYKPGDYRMIMCGEVSMDDFYVIHHEMGHIEYYMAYEKQPAIFQEGANSAIHESIGDAIMHGVMTAQHLNRIGLLTDFELADENVALHMLLLQALTKIPEIPFALIVDKFRWSVFRGDIPYDRLNRVYWELNLKYRGIVPPQNRSEWYFDAGGKFHVADNTPYIRYFLASFIQNDIFKSLCELAVGGEDIPLHKCDIYGAKKCGKKLQEAMSKGASIHWSEALQILTGHNYLTTEPFLQYYEPVYIFLRDYIRDNNVYVGW